MAYLTEQQIIDVEVFSEWGSADWKAAEFVELINQAYAAIPAEHKAVAVVELDGGYDEGVKLRMRYSRTESKAEREARFAEHQAWAARAAQEEQSTYLRLKAKYEGGGQ